MITDLLQTHLERETSLSEEEIKELVKTLGSIIESKDMADWRETIQDIRRALDQVDDTCIEAGTDYID